MMVNIHNVELGDTKSYELDCPYCNKKFETFRTTIKSALRHKQLALYCSTECSTNSKRITKEVLQTRLLEYYFTNKTVPRLRDFKFNRSFKLVFGSWTKALASCGLDFSPVAELKGNANSWVRQKSRHTRIKQDCVEKLGGQCQICGYKKNLAALQFHHRNPREKTMSLDARSLGNCSEERIQQELLKCDLLCANCHLELHNPESNL